MMRKSVFCVVALICVLGLVPANADSMKVSDLEEMCKSNNDTCRFFIWGFAQGFLRRDSLADQRIDGQFVLRKSMLICLPETETANNLMLKFKLKLAGDLVLFPDDRTQEAIDVATAILVTLFPCKR